MPANLNLLWVNKSQVSTSLSNCRDEQASHRRIRSHAVKAGHKTSCVKRPIKITTRDLRWTQRKTSSRVLPIPKSKNANTLPLDEPSQFEDWTPHPPLPPALHPRPRIPPTANWPLSIHHLTTHPDPFSSYPISLTPQTLTTLSYFTQTWSFSAFKLPGCIGYGQPPLAQHIITSLLRDCLQDETRSYCLLAAAEARRGYLHGKGKNWRGVAHVYAAKAMHGLRTWMARWNEDEKGKWWDEDDVTAIIFLAAYEIFCEDEKAAEKHLCAVRRLCKVEIRNAWVRRLRANLEVLVVRSLGGERGWGCGLG
ncbi:hypothetical protein L207DRAFT_518371 [Hyaloscypha variabilis F]|uniref:Transcription factor domain-containing protein n=1 Tax=Hyaloscypha variabilis (strain UAMH 11265 / GT02V1 / F) TaxID=1149755 RepID=A0A2J6R3D9_HYAVF|nr:hypothetical protein L207DRAFT_518371 [Hyaloscypha variabilis F]